MQFKKIAKLLIQLSKLKYCSLVSLNTAASFSLIEKRAASSLNPWKVSQFFTSLTVQPELITCRNYHVTFVREKRTKPEALRSK